MQETVLYLHQESVSTTTVVILPAAVEFSRVSMAFVVDGVDYVEEVKSHPPTASFMSPILLGLVHWSL